MDLPFPCGICAIIPEKWLGSVLHERKVWFAPLGTIHDHVARLHAAGTWNPRIEPLPYFDGPVTV